ncbi:MAG: sigma-70 family RNA polymerase sigma factor [Okeania sp. SIO3I5]|nr:sigma-70 family RNA polymerase sigma factor [Okeania sp. SIO3I5]
MLSLSGVENRNLLPKKTQFSGVSPNHHRDFWQIWESYQDYFYKLCLQWMRGNSHDAEDILNQAIIKAWNEWEKSANKIIYPKAWLKRLIHNLCMDYHRKRKREATIIDNIDELKFADHPAFFSKVDSPESNILHLEMEAYIRHQIEYLPDRLRHPFILHFYQDKSCQTIAKKLILSEDNVRKRIQKARNILKKQLNKYLTGEDKTSLNILLPSLKRDIPIGEKFQSNHTDISNGKSSTTTKNKQEEINYKVTVICQETLPHLWYSSLNSLDWR